MDARVGMFCDDSGMVSGIGQCRSSNVLIVFLHSGCMSGHVLSGSLEALEDVEDTNVHVMVVDKVVPVFLRVLSVCMCRGWRLVEF